MRPVLVIITDDDCPHCKKYKVEERAKFERRLQLDARVTIINMEPIDKIIDNKGRVTKVLYSGTNYHPELSYRYLCWYPNFILCTSTDWNNHNGPLNGIVYGGKFVKQTTVSGSIIETIIPEDEVNDITTDNLMQWVTNNLNTSKFKKKNVVKYAEYVKNSRYPNMNQ